VLALALLVPSLGVGIARHAIITAILLLLCAIHFVGVRYGAASIYVFTLGKLVPLVGFIVVALIVWKTNPLPGSFTLPAPGTKWNEVALFMLFAYAGFENLGVPAGEYKNPRRDLPRALLVGILAIAAIYVLAQLGAMASIPDLSATKTPIASAAAEIVGPIGAIIVTLGALLSMAGTNSGTVLEGSRMLYALSLDRRMGPVSYVHPRFRTPIVAILIHVIVAAAAAVAGSFAQLALLSTVARLATYLAGCASLPFLGGRTAKTIALAILGCAVSLTFVITLNRLNALAAGIALTIGAVIWVLSRTNRRTSPPSNRA
jgi:amino acid transporter